MKLYLAAPFAGRDIIMGIAPLFTNGGHQVVSGWLNSRRPIVSENLGTAPGATDRAVVEHHARLDLQEVEEADVLVHWTARFLQALDPTLDPVVHQLHSGGRHVETGFALALNKPIVLLGEPENIFQRGLSHVCPTLSDALDLLDEMSDDWG